MNVSFYCKHCGKYRRKGNHSECKRILMEAAQTTAGEKQATPRRVAPANGTQQPFTVGEFGFLAGLDAPCIPDES